MTYEEALKLEVGDRVRWTEYGFSNTGTVKKMSKQRITVKWDDGDVYHAHPRDLWQFSKVQVVPAQS